MDVILIMCLGVLAGRRFFPRRWKTLCERLQVICTLVLIFCMGAMLGRRPGFLQELGQLGLESLVFCLVPVAFSILFVYLLTCRFLNGREKRRKRR